MSARFCLAAAAAVLALVPSDASAFGRKRTAERICDQIQVVNSGALDLSDTERRLLCGDPKPDRVGKAWSEIPLRQAQANFRTFLQDRGYFAPVFREASPGVAEFDPGQPTPIRSFKIQGIPREVAITEYRTLKGERLTPQNVQRARDWVSRRLRENGYACPEILAEGDPATGVITLQWRNPATPAMIVALLEDGTTGLAPSVIRRYDAFRVGGPYRLNLLEITGRRSSEDELTLAHDLDPRCPAKVTNAIVVDETIVVGPPRVVRVRLSANTETGPQVQAAWGNTRIGLAGSSAQLSARASFKEQSLLGEGKWYYAYDGRRSHIYPRVQFRHENELRYELVALRARALWRTGGELDFGSWTAGFGFGGQNLQQIEGVGPLNRKYGSLHAELGYLSHDFEAGRRDPRKGQRAAVSALVVPQHLPGVGQPVMLEADAHWLFPIGDVDPPRMILGVRGKAAASYVRSGASIDELPLDFRRWYGGGLDARGFGRGEIPDNDYGARQGLSLGTEIRFPQALPLDLEPIAFVDLAWLRSGLTTDTETTRLFWGPGGGLRLPTTFGTVRATVAHGYEAGAPPSQLSHWQFYLSFGEEF